MRDVTTTGMVRGASVVVQGDDCKGLGHKPIESENVQFHQ